MGRMGFFVAAFSLTTPFYLYATNAVRPWQASGPWPRAAALAYADTTLSGEPESLFFNPAGLAQLSGSAIRYSHRPWALDPDSDSFALSSALGERWSLAAGLVSERNGSLYSSTLGLLAGGLNVATVAVGLGLRDAELRWGNNVSGQTLTGDVGFLWRPRNSEGLQFGASARGLPLSHPGGAYLSAHLLSIGAAMSLAKARLSLDLKSSAGDAAVQGGIEMPFWAFLTTRFGLSSLGYQGAALGTSAGFGLRYNNDFSADYALHPMGDSLGHSFSLGLRFSNGIDGFKDPVERERLQRLRARQQKEEALRLEAARGRKSAQDEDDDSGSLSLEAKVAGRLVTLAWAPPEGSDAVVLQYEVYQGMLPNAKFRKLDSVTSAERSWNGEMSLQGVTYYFQVRSLLPDGSYGPQSKVRAVKIP